jgi:hypothetical protein
MKTKSKIIEKIIYFMPTIFRLILLVAIISSIIEKNWLVLFMGLLTLFLTFLPSIIKIKYKIKIPIEFELIVIIFIYLALFLGEMRGYYTKFWWWDILLHTLFGFALGFIGFLIIYIIYKSEKIYANPSIIAAFSFCFAVTIGTLWEIFEFLIDNILGLNMQKSGLLDTMEDLIVDSIGAFFASLIGFFYLKRKDKGIIRRFISKFKKENPRLFK